MKERNLDRGMRHANPNARDRCGIPGDLHGAQLAGGSRWRSIGQEQVLCPRAGHGLAGGPQVPGIAAGPGHVAGMAGSGRPGWMEAGVGGSRDGERTEGTGHVEAVWTNAPGAQGRRRPRARHQAQGLEGQWQAARPCPRRGLCAVQRPLALAEQCPSADATGLRAISIDYTLAPTASGRQGPIKSWRCSMVCRKRGTS